MFVVNGVHRHFWLPTSKLTPLMSWPTEGKKGPTLTLSGETFGHGPTQWFGSYAISADGKEALRMTISDEPAEEHKRRLDRKKLHTIKLWIDGKLVDEVDTEVKSKVAKGLTVSASTLPMRTIGDSVPAESVDIKVPGLAVAIQSAGANKYGTEQARTRWAHLNMKMKSQLPPHVKGLVAELAGLHPLSKATKSYLTVPKVVAQHRARRRKTKAKLDMKGDLDMAKDMALQAR